MAHWEGKRTICQVTREVRDHMLKLGPEAAKATGRIPLPIAEIILDVQQANVDIRKMAKGMDDKLRYYKEDWDEGFWEDKKDRGNQ